MNTPLTAKAILLRALLDGPAHGLELIERVRRMTRGAARLCQGSVYPALRYLESDGLVSRCTEAVDEAQLAIDGIRVPPKGRTRIVYTITAQGREVSRGHAVLVGRVFGGA